MSDDINIKRDREIELETIIVLSLAGIVLFLIFKAKIFVLLSLIFLLVSLLSRRLTSVISGLWLSFSHHLGAFNSKIILMLIFYLFLTPIAFVFRIFNKNPLLIKRVNSIESYYIVRNYMPNRKDFEKVW
ncbi:MAG: hypothetical protein HZB80_00480 [Deltaproteobacteria bacterium]|nr:hypothetical protein [Deltaproteobacteria bacterium]